MKIRIDDNEQRSTVKDKERRREEHIRLRDQAEESNADKAKAAGACHPLVARLNS